jgi:hypothetical protein
VGFEPTTSALFLPHIQSATVVEMRNYLLKSTRFTLFCILLAPYRQTEF